MTRKFGKGVVARVLDGSVEKPAAIYVRVSSSKQANKGKDSLIEQIQAVWVETVRQGGQPIAVYADVVLPSTETGLPFKYWWMICERGKLT